MRTAITALGACAALALAIPASGVAMDNPANDPELLNAPIEEGGYDYAHACRRKPQPGTLRLQEWIGGHFRGESWGIVRCEKLSKKTRSLHSEGRALDWRLNAKNKAERRAANSLIDLLLATDSLGNENALARRMGVQEIIFNCRSWWSGGDGLGPYSACGGKKKVDATTAHRDHVHIGLSNAGGAAETSFWRSSLAGR
jgi:hypothetical protein